METETSSIARRRPEMTAATGMVPAWQVLYRVNGRKESQIIRNLEVCPAHRQELKFAFHNRFQIRLSYSIAIFRVRNPWSRLINIWLLGMEYIPHTYSLVCNHSASYTGKVSIVGQLPKCSLSMRKFGSGYEPLLWWLILDEASNQTQGPQVAERCISAL